MTGRWISLADCLFEAFANQSSCDPQDRRHMWAISEALRRMYPYSIQWEQTTSRKKGRCVRGCSIEEGHTCFRQEGTGGDGLKVCASCLAMILYFRGIADSPYGDSLWDVEEETPFRDLNIQGVLRLLERIRAGTKRR